MLLDKTTNKQTTQWETAFPQSTAATTPLLSDSQHGEAFAVWICDAVWDASPTLLSGSVQDRPCSSGICSFTSEFAVWVYFHLLCGLLPVPSSALGNHLELLLPSVCYTHSVWYHYCLDVGLLLGLPSNFPILAKPAPTPSHPLAFCLFILLPKRFLDFILQPFYCLSTSLWVNIQAFVCAHAVSWDGYRPSASLWAWF